MAKKEEGIRRKKVQPMPTYEELAQLLVDLTEMNVANIQSPQYAFVSCFTFENTFPDLWLTAVLYRHILLARSQAKRGRPYIKLSKEKARAAIARGE